MTYRLFLGIVGVGVILRFLLLRIFRKRLAPSLKGEKKEGNVEKIKFSKEFEFGSATAAWQIEKDVHPSNWTLAESKFKEDGTPIVPKHNNACEAMDNFDLDLIKMKELNLKIYRFGLSWSAINPSEGVFDLEYVKKYVQWCKKLEENDIKPLITLWHFENPGWIEEQGGILAERFHEYFEAFCKAVLPILAPVCRFYVTVNEPEVFSTMAYMNGVFPPAEKSLKKFFLASASMMKAHAIAYRLIHQYVENASASFAKHVIPFYPMRKWSLIENCLAYINNMFNVSFMDSIQTGTLTFSFLGIPLFKKQIDGLKNSVDYIAINHYYCAWLSINPKDLTDRRFLQPPMTANLRVHPGSDFGWPLVPESLYISIKWLNDKWNPRHLPIYITEHGIADAKDVQREKFVLESLDYIQDMDRNGIPLKGYIHWSLLDNYEWASGYSMRFGLINVDFETQKRTTRDSAWQFAKVAATAK